MRQAAHSYKAGDLESFYETLALASFRDRPVSVTLARPQDPDCPLIGVSEGFERMTGYHRSEIIGRNCRFLNRGCSVSAEDRHHMRIAVRTGRRFVGVLQNRRKDGQIFSNLLHMSSLRIGTTAYILGVQADVTNTGVDLATEATAKELCGIVDAIFAANVDAWATLQVARYSAVKLGALVPYTEQVLLQLGDREQYTKARDAFVALEDNLLQNHYLYKNTFLEVYDSEEDPRMHAMSLRRVFSEPVFRTGFGLQVDSARPLDLPQAASDLPEDLAGSGGNTPITASAERSLDAPDSPLESGLLAEAAEVALAAAEPLSQASSDRPSTSAPGGRSEAAADAGVPPPPPPYLAQPDGGGVEAAGEGDEMGLTRRNWSVGSADHPDMCTPCAFHCYSLIGCNRAEDCLWCHMDHPRKGRRRGKKRRGGVEGFPGPEDGETEDSVAFAAAATAAAAAAAPPPALPPGAVASEAAEVEAALVLRPLAIKEVAPTPGGLAPLLSALELLAPLPALLPLLQWTTGHGILASSAAKKVPRVPPFAATQARRQPPVPAASDVTATGPPAKPRATLEYTEGTIVVSIGQWKNILPLVSGSTGQSWSFSIQPQLPRGLVLNPINGVISGVPYEPTHLEGGFHTVTATEASGESGRVDGPVVAATATVYIRVLENGHTESSSYTGDRASPWTSSEE